MRDRRVWPDETEDNLRIGPCPDRDRRSAVAEQNVASGLHRRAIEVRTHQKRAPLDPFFPARRFTSLEARMLQRTRNIAGDVPGGFAERR